MKYTLCLILAVVLCACETSNFTSIPQDYSDSPYDYNSTSDYFNDRGELAQQGTNRGSFDLFLSADQAAVTIYPRLGWSYELTFDNIEEHMLSDGSTVTSFRVARSGQYLSHAISQEDNEFRVSGTNNMTLEDNNSILGNFDGLIFSDGSMKFEFESINLKSGEYVITIISGFPI